MRLVQTLNSSLDGAVVGVTGDSANAALNRLATLARTSHPVGSDVAIRELCATAFEIVVSVVRTPDGNVRVQSIEEISGVSETHFESEPVFTHKDGNFAASGRVPQFYSQLGADQAVFR
jgi:Flp pilus assembly CpaF family ATPase